MIADERLRELFKLESEEYLQRLDDGLLRLEQSPADGPLLEEVFRAAHSLKGAAHMLDLGALEMLAHQLEDRLNAARHAPRGLAPQALQAMAGQLADLRTRVRDALTPAQAAPASVARPVASERSPRLEAVVPRQPAAPPGVPDANAADAAPMRQPTPAEAPFRLDSVRIESGRLDVLLSHAGELTVTRTRVARRLGELEELVAYCGDWQREAGAANRQDGQRTPAGPDRLAPLEAMLARLYADAAEDSTRLDAVSTALADGIRGIRLLPLANVFRVFPRMVHDLAKAQGKSVELLIEGDDTCADKRVLEEMKDPLMHLLRNAVDHGIEPAAARELAGKPASGRLHLRARRTESCVEITVADDGRGLDEDAIARAALARGMASEASLAAMPRAQQWALIFAPGLSTAPRVTDVSGRGVGLDVVRTNVERLKGSLQVDSTPGRGMRITLRLPVTLVTARLLIVEVDGCPYGLPLEQVLVSKMLKPDEVFPLEGRDAAMLDGSPVALARLGDLLERQSPAPGGAETRASPCVMLRSGENIFGVRVDALLDEQEVVLKPQSALLERVRNIAGATILDSGAVCLVLNPQDLFASLRRHAIPGSPRDGQPGARPKKRILLAEDSITTRTQEAHILTDAGYEVVTAVDGLDALHKLAVRPFHALVSDVNMPNIDGLALAARIRREAKYAALPIVLVTSLASDEDRRRGLEAGANAYITKPSFDQQELLDCLERLI